MYEIIKIDLKYGQYTRTYNDAYHTMLIKAMETICVLGVPQHGEIQHVHSHCILGCFSPAVVCWHKYYSNDKLQKQSSSINLAVMCWPHKMMQLSSCLHVTWNTFTMQCIIIIPIQCLEVPLAMTKIIVYTLTIYGYQQKWSYSNCIIVCYI